LYNADDLLFNPYLRISDIISYIWNSVLLSFLFHQTIQYVYYILYCLYYTILFYIFIYIITKSIVFFRFQNFNIFYGICNTKKYQLQIVSFFFFRFDKLYVIAKNCISLQNVFVTYVWRVCEIQNRFFFIYNIHRYKFV